MSLFLNVDDAVSVDEAVKKKEDPSPATVSSLVRSAVGSELFSPEAVKAEFKIFLKGLEEKNPRFGK